MAMLTMRARRFLQRTGRNLKANGPTSLGFDMSKVECYNCHIKGHFARECRSPKDSRRNCAAEPQRRKEEPTNYALMAFLSLSSSSDNEAIILRFLHVPCLIMMTMFLQKVGPVVLFMIGSNPGYHAVPPPYTGTLMPPKPNLVFNTTPTVVEIDHSAFNVQLSPTKLEQDLSHTNRPTASIIEDWVSDSEDESETKAPQIVTSFVYPTPTSNGKRRNRKACFVCKSLDRLIKDCDYHEQQMAQPTTRNHAHRVLTQSKPISITTVRPVSADVTKLKCCSGFARKMGMETKMLNSRPCFCTTSASITLKRFDYNDALGRSKLGHINFKTMNKLVNGNLVRGLPTKVFENDNTYVACKKSKQHRASCKTKPVSSVDHPLYRLHLDLFGPTFVKSLNKKSHCLIVTDDYCRFTWVFFLATKDETSPILKTFITGLENQLSLQVKVIKSDNGTEFKNNDLNQFCGMKGTKREFSAEAVNNACYVQNRVLVTKPHNKTPYELLHGKTPSIGFMRPFGCLVTILNTLDSLGSGPTWLFDIDSLTRTMNYQPVTAGNQTNPSASFQDKFDAEKAGEEIDQQYEPDFDAKKLESEVNVSPSSGAQSRKQDDKTKKEAKGKSLIESFTRYRDLSAEFKDYSNNSINEVNATELEDIIYSNDEDDVGAEADFNNLEISITVTSIPTTRVHKDHPLTQIIEEPKRVHQALKDPSWIEAMKEELLQFKMQKVWILVDFSYGKRAIGTKWFFKNKKDERGIVVRNKARLVVQGHTHEEGIDYEKVFAPVARTEAIILFLAYASFMGFMVYQIDVKTAFLYGTIEEEVYVCQLPWFEDLDHHDKVYKVVKALYGLHQAPRAWYETLANYLLENSFQRDDIMFGATNKDLCKSFEKLMKDKFQMSSMGELTFFLGLQVKQKKDGIFISLDKYVGVNTPRCDEDRLELMELMVFLLPKVNDVTRLQALVDKKKVVVTEAMIREALCLDDEEGVECLPNEEIFAELCMSAKRTSWNKFGSSMASAVICLSSGDANENVEEVNARDAVEGDVSAAHGEVPTVTEELSIPSPTLHTPPPQLSQDIPSTSQGMMIAEMDQDTDVVLEDDKEVANEAKEGAEDAKVVDVVTTVKLITKVVTATSETITTASINITAAEAQVLVVTLTAAPSRRRKGVVIKDPEEESTTSTIIPAETKSKDKGKGILLEDPKPLKKKQQIEQDEQDATELQAELNKNIDWDEAIDHVKKKAKEDPTVKSYQLLKRKPQTEAQARKNIMVYLKNVASFKMYYFKGMSYDDTPPIFEAKFNSSVAFLLKIKEQIEEDENRALMRLNETPAERAAKRQKLDEEVEEL
nr:hypothetical protein [Tanacetum cinerariifolium]